LTCFKGSVFCAQNGTPGSISRPTELGWKNATESSAFLIAIASCFSSLSHYFAVPVVMDWICFDIAHNLHLMISIWTNRTTIYLEYGIFFWWEQPWLCTCVSIGLPNTSCKTQQPIINTIDWSWL
jgi:hypothetical protein